MDPLQGEDLGYGVYAAPGGDGEVVVSSLRLDLGWTPACAGAPGSAVLWGGRVWEVAARLTAKSGARWVLRPWPEAVVMRGVDRLDRPAVAALAELADAAARRQRGRWWSVPFLPLIGLAPAAWQQRLAESWGFSTGAATWSSATAELLLGGFGVLQGLALAFGSEWFLPAGLRWAVLVAPLLFVEALVRMSLAAAGDEPVGSLLGAPLRLLERAPAPPAPAPGPTVRVLDEPAGCLEILTPDYRPDWHPEGVLAYRGDAYRLMATERQGREWLYRFRPGDPLRPGEQPLRLHPAARTGPVVEREPPPSILATTLVTAAVTLGPRRDQELWGAHLGVRPLWLTAVSAGSEIVGGFANLGRDLAGGSTPMVLLDVYLVLEGMVRLGSAALGSPMASVFGWLLRPLYRRFLGGVRSPH